MFIKTIKRRKRKEDAETGRNRGPCETSQGPGPPAATSEEGSGKEHRPGDPRAKPERPDLGGYDLLVYFSRNRSCEGHRAKVVSGCSSLQPVSGHTPLRKGHLMSEMGT